MTFYYEWEARQRQAETERAVRRRDGWRLEHGHLPRTHELSKRLLKLLESRLHASTKHERAS